MLTEPLLGQMLLRLYWKKLKMIHKKKKNSLKQSLENHHKKARKKLMLKRRSIKLSHSHSNLSHKNLKVMNSLQKLKKKHRFMNKSNLWCRILQLLVLQLTLQAQQMHQLLDPQVQLMHPLLDPLPQAMTLRDSKSRHMGLPKRPPSNLRQSTKSLKPKLKLQR